MPSGTAIQVARSDMEGLLGRGVSVFLGFDRMGGRVDFNNFLPLPLELFAAND